MREKRYKLKATTHHTIFKFVSKGPKGDIQKLIKYSKISGSDTYNLGFGDRIGETDDFDDTIVSDNKDSTIILTTVAVSVFRFMDKYPKASVFAVGSTPSRTRLYRIGISNYLEEIQKRFKVLGFLDGRWVKFEKNQNYKAFLIKLK